MLLYDRWRFLKENFLIPARLQSFRDLYTLSFCSQLKLVTAWSAGPLQRPIIRCAGCCLVAVSPSFFRLAQANSKRADSTSDRCRRSAIVNIRAGHIPTGLV